jgi:hypothetical protein
LHPDEQSATGSRSACPFINQCINQFPATKVEVADAKSAQSETLKVSFSVGSSDCSMLSKILGMEVIVEIKRKSERKRKGISYRF